MASSRSGCKKRVHAPLKEIGDPAVLAGKAELYGIEPHDVAGMFSHGSEATPLPIPLDIHERRLPLPMGPEADDPAARFKIDALTRGGSAEVLMRLNHKLLEVAPQDDRHTAEVPASIMRVGRNELSIWCNAGLAATASPIIVHEVLISVIY